MFLCADCNFSTDNIWWVTHGLTFYNHWNSRILYEYGLRFLSFLRKWNRHSSNYDHDLIEIEDSNSSIDEEESYDEIQLRPPSSIHVRVSNPDPATVQDPAIDRGIPSDPAADQDTSSDPESDNGGIQQNIVPDPWYPFKSRAHCQLVILYQGSHRKMVDLVTFQAFMSVLKVPIIVKTRRNIQCMFL